MAKKKKNTRVLDKNNPNDIAAKFLADNLYRNNRMSIEDNRIDPWSLKDSLITANPGNLYEVKHTDDGEVISVNNGDCMIYVGRSAFSDDGRSAMTIDRIIRKDLNAATGSVKGKGGGCSLLLLIIAVVVIALVVLL